jgi:DNA-binding CsgD family transcriptional regulator/tetratricopeptide (TPR) repeat protein
VSPNPVAAFDTSSELLERAHELSTLRECLEAVRHSSLGRVVLVGGEAGIGKTALLRGFCDEHRRSARVLWGRCEALFTPPPLGPFLEIAESTDGELAKLVETSARPHEVAGALMPELRRRAPTILVLEDVHSADEATLDVLRLLARRVERVPALVLVTYRDDELDRAHPLRVVLGELATGERIGRLKLMPLSPAAVASLAEPHDVDAEALYRRTAGNPFFVTEALAAEADEIPQTVRDAVLARAARLSPAARRLLDAVAVAPPHAELWLLDALAGEAVGHLDECLAAGMLTSESTGVAFRHELARLAVEQSLAPNEKREFHRKALSALREPPSGAPEIARLAHHADAAGDADAVLEFAPRAAERAASLGAHREAAAHYARALRFGDRLAPAERARLVERRAEECWLTDQSAEAIDAATDALESYRMLGDRRREGNALRALSEILWCPGRVAECERAAEEAVSVLEELPPGRELALAYGNLSTVANDAEKIEEAVTWGTRALDLAERLGEEEIVVLALTNIGSAETLAGEREGIGKLEHALELALRTGLESLAGRVYIHLASLGSHLRNYALVDRYLPAGLEYCSEHGLELFRLYLLAHRARAQLDRGRWPDAVESAAAVLRVPRASTAPRIKGLVVLGTVRARRGDPDVWGPLDEAWALARPTGELPRIGPVTAARAEAAWLEGRYDAVADATDATLDLALRRKSSWRIGELASWRRRAAIREEAPAGAAKPYALQLAGDWARAAELWTEIGCPYEAALALADSDEEDALRHALEELQRLGATPPAVIVARRLRERGVRGLPRGPRPATRQNPANLTPRELEVLALVAQGLRNADIAERLVIAEKTVDHHVSAILRKLGVETRGQASAEAVRLGLAGQDR